MILTSSVLSLASAVYSVATTAVYAPFPGPIQVCLRYDAAAYPSGVVPQLYAADGDGAWSDITTTPLGSVVDGGLICGDAPSLPARVALLYTATDRSGLALRKAGVTNRPGANKGRPGQKGDDWGFSGSLEVCGEARAALLRDVDAAGVVVGLAIVVDVAEGPTMGAVGFLGQECRTTSRRGKVVCSRTKPKQTRAFKTGGAAFELGSVTFAPLSARKGAAACPGLSIKASITGSNLEAQSLVPSKKVTFGVVVYLNVGSDVYKASVSRCRVKPHGRGALPTVELVCQAPVSK